MPHAFSQFPGSITGRIPEAAGRRHEVVADPESIPPGLLDVAAIPRNSTDGSPAVLQ